MDNNKIPQLINKEDIANLSFKKITSLEISSDLESKLKSALLLGNSSKHKTKIIFNCDEGTREVHTTIWAIGDQHVVLKGGVHIPIKAILNVTLL